MKYIYFALLTLLIASCKEKQEGDIYICNGKYRFKEPLDSTSVVPITFDSLFGNKIINEHLIIYDKIFGTLNNIDTINLEICDNTKGADLVSILLITSNYNQSIMLNDEYKLILTNYHYDDMVTPDSFTLYKRKYFVGTNEFNSCILKLSKINSLYKQEYLCSNTDSFNNKCLIPIFKKTRFKRSVSETLDLKGIAKYLLTSTQMPNSDSIWNECIKSFPIIEYSEISSLVDYDAILLNDDEAVSNMASEIKKAQHAFGDIPFKISTWHKKN